MGSLGAWLFAMVTPLVSRVLKSMGLALVTYVGVQTTVTALLDQAKAAWGGQLADVAQLLALAGANVALSILAGALVARLSFEVFKRFEPK